MPLRAKTLLNYVGFQKQNNNLIEYHQRQMGSVLWCSYNLREWKQCKIILRWLRICANILLHSIGCSYKNQKIRNSLIAKKRRLVDPMMGNPLDDQTYSQENAGIDLQLSTQRYIRNSESVTEWYFQNDPKLLILKKKMYIWY